MRVALPFFPILGMLFCLCTAMQSMGYKAAPVASSCIELLIKAPGAALLIPTYGYLGTCMTEPRTWTIMALFLVGAYARSAGRYFPALADKQLRRNRDEKHKPLMLILLLVLCAVMEGCANARAPHREPISTFGSYGAPDRGAERETAAMKNAESTVCAEDMMQNDSGAMTPEKALKDMQGRKT